MNMKKWTAWFLVLVLMAVSFAACTGGNEDGKKTGENGVTVKGETYDNENFTIVVPTGWEQTQVQGGVKISKESGEFIEVHYRGFNQGATRAKDHVVSSEKQYGGTETKEVEFLGKSFWFTEYKAANKPQVFYSLIEDALIDGEEKTGVMLSVKHGGFEDASEAETILKTVVWK